MVMVKYDGKGEEVRCAEQGDADVADSRNGEAGVEVAKQH
jgi:hypothetical protein